MADRFFIASATWEAELSRCKPITALIQYKIKKVTNYSCQNPKVKFSTDMAKSPCKQQECMSSLKLTSQIHEVKIPHKLKSFTNLLFS